MKKRILILLSIAAVGFIIVFAYAYSETGDVSSSIDYALIVMVGLACALIFGTGEHSKAKMYAERYGTDINTGAIIANLEEQNRLLDEQNRKLEEQNRNRR